MADLQWYNTVVDSRDALGQARFWAAALGWQVRRDDPEWATVGSPGGAPPYLAFTPVPEGKVVKNRLHLDLLPGQGISREVERRRLEGLGATLVRTVVEDGVEAHDVMADPEGNEFCLLEPHPAYFAAPSTPHTPASFGP
ncbi:VOC family protein [Ornithinimicrobium sp. W1665]|uniref:VOC family protein n=1 Tax=Ornithinimicrobium sp. W1665 TaxID=3416666 RepID=UPI003CF7EC61